MSGYPLEMAKSKTQKTRLSGDWRESNNAAKKVHPGILANPGAE